MTDEHRAFTGNFVRFKPRGGAYVVEIEVDETMADEVLNRLGGLPRAGVSRPVAVAVLNLEAPREPDHSQG